MKKSPLKKISNKRKEKLVEKKELKKKEYEMFLEIWEERPHKSEVSGKWLGHEPLNIFFDHLLEKNTHPHLILEKENIALCTFEEHQLKTNGNPLPKHRELIEKAKIRFSEET